MTRNKQVRRRGAVGILGLSAALTAGGLAVLGGSPGNASSHREAPAILADPQADNTDTYAFVSPDQPETVTLLASWYPFQEPNGGPNFYPWATGATYKINVDNTGDGQADVVYAWEFRNDDRRGSATFLYNDNPVTSLEDENLLFRQRYTLTRTSGANSQVLVEDGISAPSFTGKASMPNFAGDLRAAAVRTFGGGRKAYAGAADDAFFLDLRVFDLLYGANLSEVGENTLRGYNVNTLAVQVPKTDLALGGNAQANPVVGVWATTERPRVSVAAGPPLEFNDAPGQGQDPGKGQTPGSNPLPGALPRDRNQGTPPPSTVQVSRLGHPLINEVVTAAGMKDRFNRTAPSQDRLWPELVARVTDPEIPRLLNRIYGLPIPATPRTDLVEIFLTGIGKGLGPIDADLNAHQLNADADKSKIVPAEMLRLNMSIPPAAAPNRLGALAGDLQGFPNGRRLGDDVLDIALQVLAGALRNGLPAVIVGALAAGDRVDANDLPPTAAFPYIPSPNEQAVYTQPQP